MVSPDKPGMTFPSVVDRAYREYKRHLKVKDIMSRDVVTTSPEITMEEAARIMGERRIGSLVVEKYGRPVAIVTERDLLSTVLAGRMSLEETSVEQVMSYPLITVCPNTEIREAAQIMIQKKGRLVVFGCGEMEGIITAADLIREMPEAPESSLVADDYMTRKIVTADENETVSDIAVVMGQGRIGSVLITREGAPDGIFTERDLLSKFFAQGRPLDAPVGEVCSSPIITAPAGISIHEAARIMAERHVRRLPLTRKGGFAGIITARDLVEGYAT